jgi:Protein-tyrosine phosphatase
MHPQHYTIEEGRIYAGEYPGGRTPERAAQRIRHLTDKGVRTFLDLTTPEDDLIPYGDILGQISGETGQSRIRAGVAIPDRNIPSRMKDMILAMTIIQQAILQAPAIYIHCRGGIGRTGTVVGCWFVENGMHPQDAVDKVQTLYSSNMPKAVRAPFSPETTAQREYILNWKPCLHSKRVVHG